jgi:hypothetical protein
MNRLRSILSVLLTLLIVGGLGWLLYWGVTRFLSYVSAIPKEVGAALIAGTATIMVATLTVVIGRYFERKKELDAAYRDKKTEIYDEFLKQFFQLAHSQSEIQPEPGPDDLVSFFREFMRKLLLWSGPRAIESFLDWKNHASKGLSDAKTLFLMEQFLFALRKDLGHSNFGIRKGFFARLFLSEWELFLELARKNPNITLAEVAEAEEQRKKEREGLTTES